MTVDAAGLALLVAVGAGKAVVARLRASLVAAGRADDHPRPRDRKSHAVAEVEFLDAAMAGAMLVVVHADNRL